MSSIKVAGYELKVKNMHSRSPSDPLGPCGEVKMTYIHYNIWLGEAKPRVFKLASVFLHLPSAGPKQLCALAAGSSETEDRHPYH